MNLKVSPEPKPTLQGSRNGPEIRATIADKFGVYENKINLESKFDYDLGADSLDTVELIMAFESEFDIEIPDDEAEKITTLRQAVDYINNYPKKS